jgi:hypothetical protein
VLAVVDAYICSAGLRCCSKIWNSTKSPLRRISIRITSNLYIGNTFLWITPPLLVTTTNYLEFNLYIHQTQNNLGVRFFPCILITLHHVLTFKTSHMASAACNKWSVINEASFLIQRRSPNPNSPNYPINEASFPRCIVGRVKYLVSFRITCGRGSISRTLLNTNPI